MITVDTNILARFYVDDPTDPDARRKRPAARHVMESGAGVFVPITVVLELEWVTRALYDFGTDAFSRVIEHLVGLPNVTVEDWPSVLDAIALHRQGLDFADALHLARSTRCDQLVTFDDRRFARRAARIGTTPPVSVPAAPTRRPR
jgi:predicted nucleic-acid-binding protein